MSTTLTMLTQRLDLYLAGEKAILEGNQTWSGPDGMSYGRAELREIRLEIANIRREIAALDGTGYQAQRFVFGGRC